MLGFEKWWEKFIPFELHVGDDRDKVKKEYAKAWRAALEHLLKEIEYHNHPINCEWMEVDEVEDLIKEELER